MSRAAPEFLEKAMRELIEEDWKIEKEEKFPQPEL